MDFNETFTITSVRMAGYKGDDSTYVKTFALKYSYGGVTWHNYTYQGKEMVRKVKTMPVEVLIKPYASSSF